MTRIRILLMATCLLSPCLTAAQQPSCDSCVGVNGQTFFLLRHGVGSFSSVDRAKLVNQRLNAMLQASSPAVETKVQSTDVGLLITVNGQPIVSVTDADADGEGVTRQALAERWRASIDRGLQEAGHVRSRRTLWRRFALGSLVLIVGILLIGLLRRLNKYLRSRLELGRERIPALRLRGLEVLSAEKLFRIVGRCLLTAYAFSLLVVSLVFALLIFEQFPDTQTYARQVALWLWQPLVAIFRGFIGYLPNLFFIVVIVFVTRVVMRGVDFVARQAERGVISLEPWIHRDVTHPTAQILKAILIVLALFFIAPLIPGTGSTAAKGLSVIIGLMVSFGSSSTVGNLIAGVVLTYMRPFQIGDRVKLGDTEGDVAERRFLFTKLITIKNEEVIVPSLQALGTSIINYSARAHTAGLILHTSVTIGYDAPWRKVHELLIRAAERTPGILKEPIPFVMQTSLNDFFVSYQLNAYTDQARKKAMIYSELHENIQDSFNEGGIEILSPHYFQLRDGNASTIARESLGKDHEPRRFLVDARTSRDQQAVEVSAAST